MVKRGKGEKNKIKPNGKVKKGNDRGERTKGKGKEEKRKREKESYSKRKT